MRKIEKHKVTIWAEHGNNHLAIDGEKLKCVRGYSVKAGNDIPHGISEITITFDAIVNDTTELDIQPNRPYPCTREECETEIASTEFV